MEELARDRNVEFVHISPVGQPIEEMEKLEKEILDEFTSMGTTVVKMKTSEKQGKFSSSIVQISPTNLKNIWGRRLGLEKCVL